MTSIKILEKRLTEIESEMNTRAEVIKKLSVEINEDVEERDHKQELYNKLDEESVEIRESIELLEAHLGGI